MARRGRPRHPDILTPREWEVLALLREGLTNEQLASRLDITERTAKFHVSEILGKLGLSSREQAASWQPGERRAWWLAAGAPVVFAGRKVAGAAGHGMNAIGVAVGGAMVAAALAGIVLLALLLQRDGGPSGAATSAEPRIAFSAGGSIYTVAPDGSDLREVIPGNRGCPPEQLILCRETLNTGWNAAPTLAPDGSRIGYTRDFDVWIANPDGSEARRLAAVADLQTPPDGAASNFSLGAQSIAWSPDSGHIAYVLGRIGGSGVQDLWVMNADGSDRKELSRSGGVWEQAVWLDNNRVSVVAPGKIVVFNTAGGEESAITFVDATQQFSLAALVVSQDEWLVGPITAEGPITFGSVDAPRKTVATGVSPTMSPYRDMFAYFSGDTIHIALADGSADEQLLDLGPLGGRDRFFGEQPACFPDSAPACSYRVPLISWTGSAESNASYAPARTAAYPGLGIELKYPGAWTEGARDEPIGYHQCGACVVLGPTNAPYPYGVEVIDGTVDEPDCIEGTAWRCPVAPRAGNNARQEGDERAVRVANEDAAQANVLRNPSLGFTNETGETTLYHEIWTAVPMGSRPLYLIAFWRDGDSLAEQEVRAGYDVILKSLAVRGQ